MKITHAAFTKSTIIFWESSKFHSFTNRKLGSCYNLEQVYVYKVKDFIIELSSILPQYSVEHLKLWRN